MKRPWNVHLFRSVCVVVEFQSKTKRQQQRATGSTRRATYNELSFSFTSGGVCLSACWDTPPPPLGVGLETPPPGVGLETPPGVGLDTPSVSLETLLGVGLETPVARPLKLTLGCEPGNLKGMLGYTPGYLQGMLGYHLQGMLGYPLPRWTEWQTRVKTQPSQTSFSGGKKCGMMQIWRNVLFVGKTDPPAVTNQWDIVWS